jgi:hypothetical protein
LRSWSQRKQRAKVGISGNDDPFFRFGPIENLIVACGLQPVVTDVNRVVATLTQLACEDG